MNLQMQRMSKMRQSNLWLGADKNLDRAAVSGYTICLSPPALPPNTAKLTI